MGEISSELVNEITNREYRHGYGHEFLDMLLSRQIRALRKQRSLTQAELAEMIGSQQSFISEIEDEDYGALSLSTLKDLARAFDVHLDVRFTSFSKLVNSVERTSIDDLKVPTFDEDPFFQATSLTVTAPPGADESLLGQATLAVAMYQLAA